MTPEHITIHQYLTEKGVTGEADIRAFHAFVYRITRSLKNAEQHHNCERTTLDHLWHAWHPTQSTAPQAEQPEEPTRSHIALAIAAAMAFSALSGFALGYFL